MKKYSGVIIAWLATLLVGGVQGGASADRVVLWPDGMTLSPQSIKAEFLATPYGTEHNQSWLQYALPLGVELQTHFLDIANDKRTLHALDVQYPLLSEIGPAPAISFGVRDLLGTGEEHRSFYLAVTRSLPLSDSQVKIFHDFRLTAGYGSERMDGLFVGLHTHLKRGLSIDVEYYRQRPNVSLALPVVRNTQARAYSLNGSIYYGLSYTLTR